MVRCPADVIVPSMTIQNAERASWNFKEVPKLYQAPSDDFLSCDSSGRRKILCENDAVLCA